MSTRASKSLCWFLFTRAVHSGAYYNYFASLLIQEAWLCRDADRERKNARKARDSWAPLKVFNQACSGAEAACLHNPSVQILVYAAVPEDDADTKKGGFTAQARGGILQRILYLTKGCHSAITL